VTCGSLADSGDDVFKWMLISIVMVPVLLGVQAAVGRRGPRGLSVLVGMLVVYDVLYVFMLYYLHYRWGG
jgi:hypothetical protein